MSVATLACDEDRLSNLAAVQPGKESRVLSAYMGGPDHQQKIWVITEADRSTTTLLLPDEY